LEFVQAPVFLIGKGAERVADPAEAPEAGRELIEFEDVFFILAFKDKILRSLI
jgi:hypothetical protein